MATNYSNTFEIEDTTTGKFYKVEGVEGTTREEAIQWIETLDDSELSKREIKGPAQPQAPVPMGEQETETVIQQGFSPNQQDVRFLGDNSGAFLADLAMRDVPYADVNKTLQAKSRESGIVPTAEMFVGGEEAWNKYAQAVKEAGGASSAATYTSGLDNLFSLPSADEVEAPEDPSWLDAFERGYQNAVQYGTSGILARTYHDWMDTGKDQLRKQFPDATEDELEQIHEDLIAKTQRGMRERGEKLAENDPIIPWLTAEIIGGTGVEDFVPGLGATSFAGRVGAGAGINAAASGGYQAADINAGVRDEFSGAEVAMDAALGGTLQAGLEGVAKLAKVATNADLKVDPRPQGVAVRAPDARTNSKKYKEQLSTTSSDIVDNINTITEGWTNAPEIEVHDTFKDLNGVDDDAIGVYLGDGKVAINSNAVVKEATRLNVGPEDIANSVLFHESLGHYGLEQKFREDLDSTLDEFVANSPEFNREVSKWMESNPDAYGGSSTRAAEEVLAEWSEKGAIPKTFYDMIANKIKELGRAMGLNLKYSNREIKGILASAHNTVKSGKRQGVGIDSTPRYMSEESGNRVEIVRMPDGTSVEALMSKNGDVLDTFEYKSPQGNMLPAEYKPSVEEVRQVLSPNKANEDIPTDVGYDSDKAVQLMVDAESTPGKVHISRMWPNNQNVVDFRYVDPDTGSVTYGAFQQSGDKAVGLEIYSDGPQRPGVKALREVRKQLKEQFPDLKEIQATRISGARHGGDTVNVTDGTLMSARFMKPKGDFMGVGVRSANDTDSTIKLDKNGRPILPPRVMGGRERLAYNRAMVEYHQKRLDRAYEKGNLKQLEREKGRIERYREAVQQDIKYLGEGGRRESTSTRPAVREYQLNTKAPPTREPSNERYMRPGRVDGIKVDPKELTADELFESENALDILQGVTRNYEHTLITMDDIKGMAEQRGMTPRQIIGTKSNLGELSKKLMMYDIAATKANDKLTELAYKINSGDFSVKDKNEYVRTYAQFMDLTARIFENQGEVGRALRTVQELNFTRRRVEGTQNALSDLQNALADDEMFARFVKETQEQLDSTVNAGKMGKGAELFANALNTPRALMSSMDLSAPLRQGVFLIGRPEFWKSLPTMMRSAFSEENYKSLIRDITNRETYPLMVEAKVAFSNVDGELSTREEDFMSQWAEKVPGVRRSNSAYVAFLNKLRADTFDSMLKDLQNAGVDINTPEGKKALADIGWFVSNATGRGSLPKNLNSAAPQLTAMFFSPRLMASRFNMLNPVNYAKLHPAVRKQAIKSLLSFGGFAVTLMSLASMAGMSVEADPRSSDFGKLKLGNTRYDILGGFGQYITLGARMAMFLGSNAYEALTDEQGPAHYKTVSGKYKRYNEGEGKYDQKAGDAVTRFLRNKLSPIASYLTDFYQGENVVGEKFEPVSAAQERMTPMFIGDILDMMEEYGMEEGAVRAAPGMFGIGVQDFVPSNLDPEAHVDAPRSFKDKNLEDSENDSVRVKDGVVTLKGAAREEWERRLNFYIEEWMKDEMSSEEWETLSDEQKEEAIKEVRADARDQTKEDMLPLIGVE